MREIVLDTETTGLDYKAGDRIIEIGCVELINYVPTGSYLQFYCKTNKEIGRGASRVHGITNDFLNAHATFKDQVKNFLDFIKDDVLIIHNAEFDIGFINNELKLIGISTIKNKIIDTVVLAREKLNSRIANLDYLCRRFSIDLTSRKTHGALLDCQLLAEVYLELKGGKQTKLELTGFENNKIDVENKRVPQIRNIKEVSISHNEIESHKKLVKGLKKGIWEKMDY